MLKEQKLDKYSQKIAAGVLIATLLRADYQNRPKKHHGGVPGTNFSQMLEEQRSDRKMGQ